MAASQRTWIEISGSHLRHNFAAYQELLGPAVSIMPIVKAHGYGHDAQLVIQALRGFRTAGYGVAHGDEALTIRQAGYRGRLIVLSSWQLYQLPELLSQSIELVAWDWPSLARLETRARSGGRVAVHLKLDTGTSRIGWLPSDLPKLYRYCKSTRLQIKGVFSHLANAEESGRNFTQQQVKRFTTLITPLLSIQGIQPHIACTASLGRYPEAHFGLVRLGFGLYGYLPSPAVETWNKANQAKLRLQPVLTWKTRVLQVKRVPAGTAIGYGSTAKVKRASWIGILPVGYYDGYDRRLSNSGWVRIGNRTVPIIGRVCMNLTMINLGQRACRPGTEVTLVGSRVPATDLCQAAGLFSYEFLSRINPEVSRRLV